MFSADMADEEWEVEIQPSSRYYTEGELVERESILRSTQRRTDCSEAFGTHIPPPLGTNSA